MDIKKYYTCSHKYNLDLILSDQMLVFHILQKFT